VGAVDGQPAVGAVPDGGADDVAAAHGVAAQVIVQTVAPQDTLFAEVAELGVADRAGRAAVIHRVATISLGVGRLDDDIPAEVRDLAAIKAVPQVLKLQRRAQDQLDAVDAPDSPFLRGSSLRFGIGSWTAG